MKIIINFLSHLYPTKGRISVFIYYGNCVSASGKFDGKFMKIGGRGNIFVVDVPENGCIAVIVC
jgi:hypothetical protein